MGFEAFSSRFQNCSMNNTTTENLFRKQAIASLSRKQPGNPICLMPKPWLWLGSLATLLFVSIFLFVANAEYSRKETVRGWLVSKKGVVRITGRTTAIINQLVRQPGDHIREGDPLIYLSNDSTMSDGTSKSEEVLAQLRQESQEIDGQLNLSKEQQRLENLSLVQQLAEFVVEVSALESRLEEQKHRIGLSNEKLQRLQSAFVGGAVTQWDVIKQQEDLGSLQQGLSQLQQAVAAQKRERERLRGERNSVIVRAKAQRSALRARHMQLSQQIAEHELRRLSVMVSPINGTIASVEVHAGYSIAPQQLLMTILPENAGLAAELFVPSRAAGFAKPGQLVRIAYDAFPQQKFGTFDGRISRISDFVLLPGEIPTTFSIREATYKFSIAIVDSSIQTSVGTAELRPGMLLAADIILEKRNLMDWLLEPLHLRLSPTG